MLRFKPQSLSCLRGTVVRHNSTTAGSPPLLAKIRSDLKDAMRTKDTARLNVLRSVISETNNAGKTQRPIETDFQLLTLLNKRTHSLQDAASEFTKVGRDDLKAKAAEELAVLETYASQVQTMNNEEIQSIVSSVISNLEQKTLNVGAVMKALISPGGALEGKPAVRADVAKIVEKSVQQAKAAVS